MFLPSLLGVFVATACVQVIAHLYKLSLYVVLESSAKFIVIFSYRNKRVVLTSLTVGFRSRIAG